MPAVAVYLVSVGFRSLRWSYLMRPLLPLSPLTLYPYVVIGYMANNLLPARVGEIVRAYIVRERYQVSIAGTLGTIAVERLFDGLTLVLFLALVGASIGVNSVLRTLGIVAAALFLAGLIVMLLVARRPDATVRFLSRLARPLPVRLQSRLVGLASAFIGGLASLRSSRAVLMVLVTSVAAWALEATMYYMVGIAFGLSEAFPVYLMVTAAANLAITAPSSAGGVGPFEALAKETLVFVGVGASLAAAYAVALHAVLLVPVIALGLVFLWLSQLSLREVLTVREAPGRSAQATMILPIKRPSPE